MDITQAKRQLAELITEEAVASNKVRILVHQIETEHNCDLAIILNAIVEVKERDKALLGSVTRHEWKTKKRAEKFEKALNKLKQRRGIRGS